MAHERRIPNYRKMYPTASEEVIAVLRQSERRLQYLEYDLKVERFVLDETKQVAFFMCAQHGRTLVGASPIRGLVVPTVSQEQGCRG